MQLALATAGLGPALNPGPVPARLRPEETGTRRRVEADVEIYAEGERALHFYKVVSGAVRTCRLLSDGRRQIDGFHLPGDIFGLEAGEAHRTGAEAIVDTVLAAHRRSDRDALTGEAGALAREVVAAMLRALARAQDHMLLLGRKTARERVASFLLGLADRAGADGVLALPMSRVDIADHLGLTVESVSRTFTQLERDGIIALPAHRRSVELRDRAALRRLDG
ncbi:CRP/FNR family transcriptional regulator, nitrogen fixation regulation protein [Methylobacterium sp. ap11]|uniref:helix-turn-helix domain-containing protein n=1 Tax=Methylobacterium sp. ap11 TaxID=1761799 RepID=UPI0008BEECB6|nr:helix-turn-helix domain-containing protein [Methylobacterium sp. ap11]SEP44356.1 CRP/FNR family transcriptional regulator, nitrogen fixation regulation protein [Methylobacterium sp. ap11]